MQRNASSPAHVHILNKIGSILNVHLSTLVCKLNLDMPARRVSRTRNS
jgi:hypothetical protein